MIDGDGHVIEYRALFEDYLLEVAGRNHRLNPMGTKLKAIFSSDIGHWDVEDIGEVLEEAYELVEHKHIDESDFRAFTFTNIAELHSSLNSDFFKGTVVEDAVGKLHRSNDRSKAEAAD